MLTWRDGPVADRLRTPTVPPTQFSTFQSLKGGTTSEGVRNDTI